MRIDDIDIINFKNFKDATCSFSSGVNLFVGSNGTGKTSILEAINVALGCFFGSQEGKMQCLMDMHHSRIEFKVIDSRPLPVRTLATHVEASNSIIGKPWKRIFNSTTKSNDEKGKYPASDYGRVFFEAFNNQEDRTIAPIIAYYSTQRLFRDSNITKKQKYDAANGRRNGYLQALKDDAIKGVLTEWLKNAATRRATLQIKEIDQIDHVLENVEESIRKMLLDFLDLKDITLKIYQEPDFNDELFLQIGDQTALPLSYYSDGFRNLIYLVMDLVWRASQLNPWMTLAQLSAEIKGVVTIDEIDLHLHPKWQAKAIPFLQQLFPAVQFFITTHSPVVVANFNHGALYVLEDNKIRPFDDKYFGKDVDSVLRNVLNAMDRNKMTQEKIDQLFKLIDEEKTKDIIQPVLAELTELLGIVDPEIQRANSLMEWNEAKKEG
ncbi:MAG: AAA family ATPase [Bacteroidetes bacterium]|nr:AAA family ATPase [Bacteroidota bacterium]